MLFKIYKEFLFKEEVKLAEQKTYLINGLGIIIKEIGSQLFEIIKDFNELY